MSLNNRRSYRSCQSTRGNPDSLFCFIQGFPNTVHLLPSATKLRRLCFYRCVSVHRGVVSQHALQQVSGVGAGGMGGVGAIPACIAGGIPACLATGLQGVYLVLGGCPLWGRGVCSRGCLVQGVVCSRGLVSQHELRQTSQEETATAVDGTHPTGMHSCFNFVFNGLKLSGFNSTQLYDLNYKFLQFKEKMSLKL